MSDLPCRLASICDVTAPLLANKLNNPWTNQSADPVGNQLANKLNNPVGNQLANKLNNPIGNQLANPIANQLANPVGNQLANPVGNQLANTYIVTISNIHCSTAVITLNGESFDICYWPKSGELSCPRQILWVTQHIDGVLQVKNINNLGPKLILFQAICDMHKGEFNANCNSSGYANTRDMHNIV